MLSWIVLFCVGGFGYGEIELLYRGSTHWSMLLAGGLCLVLLRWIDLHLPQQTHILTRCAIGTGTITAIELFFGIICNKVLAWNVWDYSQEWGNLWGQICPRYALYWFALCLPIFAVFHAIRRFFPLWQARGTLFL